MTGTGTQPKVLIVDDEAVVRDFLFRVFSLKGLHAKTAEDGEKAVKMAKDEQFDVFFLDVMMPGINGLETLRELKKISPSGKYVMMTGYAVDDILKQASCEGACASIKKPFDIKQVTDIIDGQFGREDERRKVLKILVIDDDRVVLNFFMKLLRDYDVTTALTGKDGLEEVGKSDFDLIFLDLTLKDVSGLELCNKILGVKPGSEIILITGDPTRDKEAEGLAVRAFLWKPFEIDKILKEVSIINKQKYK